jgi:putative two-component system response regulator
MRSQLTPSDHAKTRGTVMIVDDEKHVRTLLSRWLSDDGWICQTAESAAQAITRLEASPAHVVVSDINMPEKSGIWLLEQIKSHFHDTFVVMLTGFGETRTAIDCLTKGASSYLLKPIERDDLVLQIRRTQEHRELTLERGQRLVLLEMQVREQTLAIRTAYEETIHRLLGAATYRDQETGSHIRRTGLFSEVLALAAGWSPAEAEELRMAAPMHDIGKIGIPDTILLKQGRLTESEFEVMKQHTVIGAGMLAGSMSPVIQLGQSIALNHHERWDGGGYPHGLSGESIPEAARILSIVDVYDALSHDRVYRRAFSEEQVIGLLRLGMGTQFDPTLLTVFFTVFDQIQDIAALNPDDVDLAESSPDSRLNILSEIGCLN